MLSRSTDHRADHRADHGADRAHRGARRAAAAPENAAPENAAPENAAPENAAPENAAPENAARVLDAFRAIVRASRTSTRALEMRFGTSAAQLFMLRALAAGEVGSVKELAQRTNTHNSSASVVVRRLCERGLVRRTTSPDDRRRVGYAIAPDGLAYLAAAPRAVDDHLAEGIAALSGAEQARLADLLRQLVLRAEIQFWDRGPVETDPAPQREDAAD